MSSKVKAIQLLDRVPEYKIDHIVAYIEGVIAGSTEIPNQETMEAFDEGDKMLENGSGHRYSDTKDLFADLEG